MPAIVIGPGDLGSCVLIPHREREIACLCKCQTRRIIEQLQGIQPRVFVTTIEPSTTPGAIATKINRDRLDQMAAPKLPTTTASGQAGVTQ